MILLPHTVDLLFTGPLGAQKISFGSFGGVRPLENICLLKLDQKFNARSRRSRRVCLASFFPPQRVWATCTSLRSSTANSPALLCCCGHELLWHVELCAPD